jgi:hypothetical protein
VINRFPTGRQLTQPELRDLAAAVGEAPHLWRNLVRHDPEQRQYTRVYRDPYLDIWLICWTNQQDTGYHDHDLSAGAVNVVEGELVEDRFEFGDGGLHERSTVHEPGSIFDFAASHVHRLRHQRGTVATSLHVYSPSLWRMGYYDRDEHGLLTRTSISYAEELDATESRATFA